MIQDKTGVCDYSMLAFAEHDTSEGEAAGVTR